MATYEKQLAYLKESVEAASKVSGVGSIMRMARCTEDDIKSLDKDKIRKVVSFLGGTDTCKFAGILHHLFDKCGVKHKIYGSHVELEGDKGVSLPNIVYVVCDGCDDRWYFYRNQYDGFTIAEGTEII